jgi:Fe(3+) dicitrate transport protein
VGNSRSKGLEAVVEFSPVKAFLPKSTWGDVRVFASYSYTDAKYDEFEVVQRVGNDLVKSNLVRQTC